MDMGEFAGIFELLIKSFYSGFLGDWGLVDRVAESEGFTEPPVKKKTSGLASLYVNTKSRLYNLVRPSMHLLLYFLLVLHFNVCTSIYNIA